MKAFYLYDLKTGDYVGSGFAESIPENATELPPVIRYSVHNQKAMKKPIFKNGKWIEKENSDAKTAQQLLMQQSQQITVLQTMVMQQDQDNVKLQKANAEQASQIKQLQQIFMKADQQQAIEKSKEATQ